MRICPSHWTMCREAVEQRGLSSLVARDGEQAMERMVGELKGEDVKETFDPLMSLHWHFTNDALRCGGLYLLGLTDAGEPYCPICEFEKNAKGFVASEAIGDVADQMASWARSEGLIPPAS